MIFVIIVVVVVIVIVIVLVGGVQEERMNKIKSLFMSGYGASTSNELTKQEFVSHMAAHTTLNTQVCIDTMHLSRTCVFGLYRKTLCVCVLCVLCMCDVHATCMCDVRCVYIVLIF